MTTTPPTGNRFALLRPFERFFGLESASGILLLLSAALALVWANSPWADSYFHLWETKVTVGGGALTLSKSLHHWINDGLMAVFFFVVGLELKREVLMGELASPRQAALSVVAAVGGMAVPAALYAALNAGSPGAAGWGIPMATDIAFALGVLALLGPRVPTSLKIFVTAVAIVDDLGAVLVIALFYTAELSMAALGIGALALGGLVMLNVADVRRPLPYVLIGIVLWIALLKSGVHATIAGVLMALTIPAQRKIDAPEYLERMRAYLQEFADDVVPERAVPTADQRDAIHAMEQVSEDISSPLARLEHELHPWVAFLIVPIFALANAGVSLAAAGPVFEGGVTTGVLLGLFIGKPVGIVLASWLAVRAGIAALPDNVGWTQLLGVGILCGIGFTMSLFIATLGFEGTPELLDQAKVGVLAASALAGVVGAVVLSRAR